MQIAFSVARTIRGVTIASPDTLKAIEEDAGEQTMDVSGDGIYFRHVIHLPKTLVDQRTYAFAPVTGR